MFESLSTRLQNAFRTLKGEVRLKPETVEVVLREIRLALLEADVNFRVVKAFGDRVRDRAVSHAVLESLTPVQQVISIVRDELLQLFGTPSPGLMKVSQRPQVVVMTGLQGSGKTTTTVKLGKWFLDQGRQPLLVSTDFRRPGAIEQLAILARDAKVRVYETSDDSPLNGVELACGAITDAKRQGFDVVIVDTAGRLHVDSGLMGELSEICKTTQASDILYVADAMTGQDAIKSAGEFHSQVGLTGVVMSKMDGDSRGGAALSVVSVVGVPVVFGAMGERVGDIEVFKPERMVSRILGMGDVLSLVERAEQVVSERDAGRLEDKIRRNRFTLQDFRDQLVLVGRMGPIERLVEMMPGVPTAAAGEIDPSQLTRCIAIIDSMTPFERRSPTRLNGNRRKRVARGSGTNVQEVNRVLKQFVQMQKMFKSMGMSGGRRFSRRGLSKAK